MRTNFKTLGLALGISAASMIAPVNVASAQDGGMTLDQLLQRVQQGRVEENRENARREQEFRNNRARQGQLLAQAQADVRREEAESDRLKALVKANKETLAIKNQQLQEALGEFNELIGVVKQVSGDTRAILTGSLISAEYQGRADIVGAIAEKESIPTTDELEALWAQLHGEMTYQGEVKRFTATVASADGAPEEVEVVRIGPFNAMRSGGRYLKYDVDQNTGTGALANLGRQPGSTYTSAASSIFNADPGEIARAGVDPSQGSILATFILTPTLFERVQQGAEVGYVIIAIGALAVVLGLLRIASLFSTNGAVKRQIRNKRINKGNPLGRIMMAYEENKGADVETLELKLDEAIMKEVPKLERGLNLLKVIAAVAPMMGLLGTVTGMILTFQAIQLYGTGDPQVMAGGISQALITTVLGLVTAIPVLLLHSFASGMSTSVTQVLEEQAVGIVARHAEGG